MGFGSSFSSACPVFLGQTTVRLQRNGDPGLFLSTGDIRGLFSSSRHKSVFHYRSHNKWLLLNGSSKFWWFAQIKIALDDDISIAALLTRLV